LTGIAPVLVGEFGGRSVGNDQEGIWQRELVTYLQANGFDYTYWCWNPNSGDTGGILEDDWATINQAKLNILRAYQWPLLGSPVPAEVAVEIPVASPPPSTSAAPPGVPAPARAVPAATVAIGGPFDPDALHALLGAGGPSDPDPAHRLARQADEQRYLEQTGAPWDRAVYVTASPNP
jgi:hypothetical protein